MNLKILSSLLLLLGCNLLTAQEDIFSKKYIKQVMKAAYEWQQDHPKHALNDWTNGAYYTGVTKAWQTTKDKSYRDGLLEMGTEINWNPGNRWYHADDIIISYSFIELYKKNNKWVDLGPTKNALDQSILYGDAHEWGRPKVENMIWWWCDALFMGPPVFVNYGVMTDNDIYLKATDKWYKECYDQLYDQEAHLWTRDNSYLSNTGKLEENGEKIFWSRGNGWVFAGLALLLEEMPKDYPNRDFYVQIYTEMAAKLLEIQPEDGAWRSSLLYPEGHEYGESSGTGFYIFGLAYGVRNGYLPAREYLPAIKKGWAALLKNQQENGMVGFVQPIGEAPTFQVNKDLWERYGTGAFLCAGSEVMQLNLSK
jgi:rhamnogalacturonyl hydrolase YesR